MELSAELVSPSASHQETAVAEQVEPTDMEPGPQVLDRGPVRPGLVRDRVPGTAQVRARAPELVRARDLVLVQAPGVALVAAPVLVAGRETE